MLITSEYVSVGGAVGNGGGTNLALRKLVYLLPLEGGRGEEPSLGEVLGGSLGGRWVGPF